MIFSNSFLGTRRSMVKRKMTSSILQTVLFQHKYNIRNDIDDLQWQSSISLWWQVTKEHILNYEEPKLKVNIKSLINIKLQLNKLIGKNWYERLQIKQLQTQKFIVRFLFRLFSSTDQLKLSQLQPPIAKLIKML